MDNAGYTVARVIRADPLNSFVCANMRNNTKVQTCWLGRDKPRKMSGLDLGPSDLCFLTALTFTPQRKVASMASRHRWKAPPAKMRGSWVRRWSSFQLLFLFFPLILTHVQFDEKLRHGCACRAAWVKLQSAAGCKLMCRALKIQMYWLF